MPKEYNLNDKHFEREVREKLSIPEGQPILDEDLRNVTHAVFEWGVFGKDVELLYGLTAVKELSVETPEKPLFLKNMPDLEELNLVYYGNDVFDCNWVSHLKKLKVLEISGGTISSMQMINTESLTNLINLTELYFHEFGDINLAFLRHMEQLALFYCGYANEVKNVDAIGSLKNLKELVLIDFPVEDLDFLKTFDSDIKLDICALWLPERFDESKLEDLHRFNYCEVCELRLGNKQIPFEISRTNL